MTTTDPVSRAFQLVSILVIACALAASCAPAVAIEKHPPDTAQVVAEGEAPAKAANARELAIASALKSAVSQAIGTYVLATAIGANYKLVHNEIITKASGFAVLDSVESESVQAGILKVRVKARVSAVPLAERLRELGLTHEWKVSIVSTVKGCPDRTSLESAIARQLSEAGFRVTDEDSRKELAAAEAKVRAANGDAAAAALVAREFGADIVVVASALVENVDSAVEGGVTFYRSRCIVTARACYVDTGDILAQTETTMEALDQSPELSARQCLRKAGARIGSTLSRDILIAPAEMEPFVVVKVTNLKTASTAAEIERTLRAFPGVSRVTRQRLSGGTLELNVHVNADMRGQLPVRLENSKPGRRLALRTEMWTKTFLQAHAP